MSQGRLTIDASVAVKWLHDEQLTDRAVVVLRSETELHAPDLIGCEVMSALWKLARRNVMTPTETTTAFEVFGRIPIHKHPDRDLSDDALAFALDLNHSPYDCLYLALARRLGCPLLTADDRFAEKVTARPDLSSHLRRLADMPATIH